MEKWITVAEAPDYEVSSLGRVRSVPREAHGKRWRGRELSQHVRPDGYLAVNFSVAGKVKGRLVHKVVCEAFHGPAPSKDHVVRHKDGDRSNARADNLRWGTRAENAKDSIEHGTHFMAGKLLCKRGHRLEHPNLVVSKSKPPHWRMCRSCHRGLVMTYRDGTKDVQAEADKYYARLTFVS